MQNFIDLREAPIDAVSSNEYKALVEKINLRRAEIMLKLNYKEHSINQSNEVFLNNTHHY